MYAKIKRFLKSQEKKSSKTEGKVLTDLWYKNALFLLDILIRFSEDLIIFFEGAETGRFYRDIVKEIEELSSSHRHKKELEEITPEEKKLFLWKDEDRLLEVLQELLVDDYSPSVGEDIMSDLYRIEEQLGALYFFYNYMATYKISLLPAVIGKFEFAKGALVMVALEIINEFQNHRKQSDVKKLKKDGMNKKNERDRKEAVTLYGGFVDSDEKLLKENQIDKIKPWQIARSTYKKLLKTKQSPPTEQTIYNYAKKEGLIERIEKLNFDHQT